MKRIPTKPRRHARRDVINEIENFRRAFRGPFWEPLRDSIDTICDAWAALLVKPERRKGRKG